MSASKKYQHNSMVLTAGSHVARKISLCGQQQFYTKFHIDALKIVVGQTFQYGMSKLHIPLY